MAPQHCFTVLEQASGPPEFEYRFVVHQAQAISERRGCPPERQEVLGHVIHFEIGRGFCQPMAEEQQKEHGVEHHTAHPRCDKRPTLSPEGLGHGSYGFSPSAADLAYACFLCAQVSRPRGHAAAKIPSRRFQSSRV